VPAGLIENEDRVGAGGYVCGDLIEMKLHCFGVAEMDADTYFRRGCGRGDEVTRRCPLFEAHAAVGHVNVPAADTL
jgi:hypothetical protein